MKHKKFIDLVESYWPNWSDDNWPELMWEWLSELSLDEMIEYAQIAYDKWMWIDEIFNI